MIADWYEAEYPKLRRWLWSRCGDAAEDVLSEAVIGLLIWEEGHPQNIVGPAMLYQKCLWVVTDYWKNRHKRPEVQIIDTRYEQSKSYTVDHLEDARYQELLETVPERYRPLLELRAKGYYWQEAAEELGVEMSGLKKMAGRLQARARKERAA